MNSEEWDQHMSDEEDETNHFPVISSTYRMNQYGPNKALTQWLDGSSICMSGGDSVIMASWDRVPSETQLEMVKRFSEVYENLHLSLNQLRAVYDRFAEGDVKNEYMPKKLSVLDAIAGKYCEIIHEKVEELQKGVDEEASILLVNAIITWNLCSIFYCKRKNSKTRDFLEWVNGFLEKIRLADVQEVLRSNPEMVEKDPAYWDFLYKVGSARYLIRADYDHFVILLKNHSWRRRRNQDKSPKAEVKAEIIDGIIDALSRKPNFYNHEYSKEEVLKAHDKYLNYIKLGAIKLKDNFQLGPQDAGLQKEVEDIYVLLNVLMGDPDGFEIISKKDWKINLSLYLQFSNILLNRDDARKYIDTLRLNHFAFADYDEIFLEIITNKKAQSAMEKMNFLFPKYITAYFYDLLFEYDALLTEPIERFELRTFQEQNMVDYLIHLGNADFPLEIMKPFLSQLRYLDSIRGLEENEENRNLNECHENLCSSLILAKVELGGKEEGEEKLRQLFGFIDKLNISLDVKARILKMKLQQAKRNHDWKSFIWAQFNQERKDFSDINLIPFFLGKLLENENFEVELVASQLLGLKTQYQGATNLKIVSDSISQFAELNALAAAQEKGTSNMKKALTILLDILESKTLDIELWPLVLKLFLHSTCKSFKEFSYTHFELMNRQCQKIDEYFFVEKKRTSFQIAKELWGDVKPRIQYHILSLLNNYEPFN